VLATQELTDEAVGALRDGGIDQLMPFQALNPGDTQGNGLWSSQALTELERPDGFENDPVAATIDVDGGEVLVVCVHPESPYPAGAQQWSVEMQRLAAWLGDVERPAIVAGDFNSTSDHRQFRGLLDAGFADAAAQVGAGWLPTFPANRRRVPLLITIDHVLSNDGIVATDVQRVDIDDTDHAALVVRLAVPTGV
jgi:endonuclease/exonuclease/phosphatase (EEP) superfamily protein YafD